MANTRQTSNDKLTQEFLHEIKEISDEELKPLGFRPDSFEEKGFAYFIKFKRGDTVVEFLFGPSEWHVEMIVKTLNGKFALKELMEIPAIAEWISKNSYKESTERNIKAEIHWEIDLLKIALPYVE